MVPTFTSAVKSCADILAELSNITCQLKGMLVNSCTKNTIKCDSGGDQVYPQYECCLQLASTCFCYST